MNYRRNTPLLLPVPPVAHRGTVATPGPSSALSSRPNSQRTRVVPEGSPGDPKTSKSDFKKRGTPITLGISSKSNSPFKSGKSDGGIPKTQHFSNFPTLFQRDTHHLGERRYLTVSPVSLLPVFAIRLLKTQPMSQFLKIR